MNFLRKWKRLIESWQETQLFGTWEMPIKYYRQKLVSVEAANLELTELIEHIAHALAVRTALDAGQALQMIRESVDKVANMHEDYVKELDKQTDAYFARQKEYAKQKGDEK